MPSTFSPGGHLINVMELPQAYGCVMSECHSLTSSLAVSRTTQDCKVTNFHTVEKDFGDCVETQRVPKAHYSNDLSGPGFGCPPNGHHVIDNQLVVNDWQYDNPR